MKRRTVALNAMRPIIGSQVKLLVLVIKGTYRSPNNVRSVVIWLITAKHALTMKQKQAMSVMNAQVATP